MWASFCLLGIAVAAADDDAATAFQSALAVLQHQDDHIETLTVEFTSETSHRQNANEPLRKQPHLQVDKRQGTKFRVDDEFVLDPTKSQSRTKLQFAFNGIKQTTFVPAQNRGSIETTDSDNTYGYRDAAYGWKMPLGQKLQERASEAVARWLAANGRKLLEVTWKQPEIFAVVIVHLDPEARWQPREIVTEHTLPTGAYTDARTKEIMRKQVLAYAREGEFVLPSEIRTTIEAGYQDGTMVRFDDTQTRVTKFHWNQPIPEEEFEIQFPEGSEVYDKDREVVFIVGKPGSEKRVNSRTAPTTSATVSGPAYVWWADWRLWIGVCVASISALVFFRSR